jgi:hypothetical protein
MTAGKLGSVKPAATTNTFLYRCPITSAASTVLNVVEQGGSAATYRAALRDYDQILTLDSANYQFRRGNIASSYVISLIPGVSKSSLTAGDIVASVSGESVFRYLDVYVDASIKNISTKVACVGTTTLGSAPTGGNIVAGNTITGEKGLTASVLTYSTTFAGFTASIPKVTAAATGIYFANTDTLVANDFAVVYEDMGAGQFTYEVMRATSINTTTNIVTVQRAQLSTLAAPIMPGTRYRNLRPTATTTTLAAGIADTDLAIVVADASAFTIGNYLRIGNELLGIQAINGNDITVLRAEFGTTAAAANGGDTVTYVTDEGFGILQYFDSEEVITVGAVSATLQAYSTTGNPFGPEERFIFDTDVDGIYEDPADLTLDIGRTYRFLQSDASNLTHTIRFREVGSTDEYTTGVTVIGTAGSAGAYTEIVISSLTATTLEIYSDIDDTISLGVSIDADPIYSKIYVYDVDGTLATGQSFSTQTGTNEIDEVYPGPYGYIHGWVGTSLKVSLGRNSTAYAQYTTTISASSGATDITVGSSTNLIPGMSISGTGIAAGSRIAQIVDATTITIDLAATGAVSGTGTFKHMFYDSPRLLGSSRSNVTVSSFTALTDVNAEDYLYYGSAVGANSTVKNSGIVVGPGQSVVVYASTADVSFSINGFEDSTSDFVINQYNRV